MPEQMSIKQATEQIVGLRWCWWGQSHQVPATEMGSGEFCTKHQTRADKTAQANRQRSRERWHAMTEQSKRERDARELAQREAQDRADRKLAAIDGLINVAESCGCGPCARSAGALRSILEHEAAATG